MNQQLEERLTAHLHERADVGLGQPNQIATAHRLAHRRTVRQRAVGGVVVLLALIGLVGVVTQTPFGNDDSQLATAAPPEESNADSSDAESVGAADGDGAADAESSDAEGIGAADGDGSVGESLLGLFDDAETARLDADDRYLIDLLISPEDLPDPYRVNVVQSDDPNGNAEIGDRWYEPRLRVQDCAVSTDQALFPGVEAGFIPGDPSESELSNAFAAMNAPYQAGIRIELFDTSAQRDAVALVMQDFYRTSADFECSVGDGPPTDIFRSELATFEPFDVGHPGYGYTMGRTFGEDGETHQLQYWVGERVLLTVVLTSFPSDTSLTELDLALAEPFVRLQVAKLEALGFG